MKVISSVIVALAVAFVLIATPASAQVAKAYETWQAAAYCLGEEDAELLSRMMAEQGGDGYVEVMHAEGVKCWDSRLLKDIITPYVKLLEKQWSVTTSIGQKFDFWTAVSQDGTLGWVWFEIEDDDSI